MDQALRDLWALQLADSRIDEFEKMLAKLDTGAAAAREHERSKAAYDQAAAALHAVESELKDVDLNMKSTEQKRKDQETRLYSGKVTAARELDALQTEVEMLARNRDKLETRELELMDAQVAAREAVAVAQKDLSEKQLALDAALASSSSAREEIEKSLRAARQDREPHESALQQSNPMLLRKYQSLRPKLQNQAVATITGNSCSVCHVHLPSHMIREARAGDDVVMCESCGRMLVVVED
ncbi:MAG: hypothetical protein IT209_08140 [Armatimonadetes bacterium]|nr:hypothetical protein [Armatimonadota bacterium]